MGAWGFCKNPLILGILAKTTYLLPETSVLVLPYHSQI